MSGTQVRNIHRVLHNLLNYARRMGGLAVNPADAVEKPRDETAEWPVYSPDEVRAFLTAAADDRPGIGQLLISSVQAFDFPVIQAITLMYSIVFIGILSVVDTPYRVIDPRA